MKSVIHRCDSDHILGQNIPLRFLTGGKLLPHEPAQRDGERPYVIETRGVSLEGDRNFKHSQKKLPKKKRKNN